MSRRFRVTCVLTAALAGAGIFDAGAQTNVAADFAALTSGLAGTNTATPGTPGNVVAFGRDSFPVLEEPGGTQRAVMAAGRAGTATNSARAVAYSHTGYYNTNDPVKTPLFDNAVLWASRKATRPSVRIGLGPGFNTGFFTNLGYLVKSVTTSMTTTNNDLTGCDVFVASWGSGYTTNALTKITNFTAAGGGVVSTCTPWALSDSEFATANTVLDTFGLVLNGTYSSGTPVTIPTSNWPAYHSAIPAADLLLLDKQGTTNLTLAVKTSASMAIDFVYEVRSDVTALNTVVEQLSQAYGLIKPTDTATLAPATQPVEAMLARYQSRQFDVLTPGQLFVHPGASNYPGLPRAGPLVARTINVNGNTPQDFYMNLGDRPTRVETGLYAPPGAAFTVVIPASLTNAGLQVHIGGTQDTLFNLTTWQSFPKIWRRDTLSNAVTQIGHVFGGLITLLVPANTNLGNFQITVSNALAAPAFVLGQNTDAEWYSTLRTNPGAWGFIQCTSATFYIPALQLADLRNPTEVAQHWQRVMDTADANYGYTPYRKRGEAVAGNRQCGIPGAGAYAGYPIECGWGGDRNEVFLNTALRFGHWGTYHELGHGFQNDFDSEFVIAVGAEVDVNLFPGLIYTLLHDRSPWDNNTHSTFDAATRLTARTNFFALAASNQTWAAACSTSMGYDFYFNLAETFGRQAYSNALGRLMRWLQSTNSPAVDAELSALNAGDPNYKRNRFYLLFCDATQRNLDTYFQRYGLGVTNLGYDITASVKSNVAAKGYAVWTNNAPLTGISDPGTLNFSENLAPGTALYTFTATEPDAHEILTYEITAGNTDGAFSLDRHTGVLRVSPRGFDYERATSYSLTVRVSGNGVPLSGVRPTASRTFTVNVVNVPDGPSASAKIFTATNTMAVNAVLGTCTALVEAGRTLSKWEIVLGNSAGLFAISNSGQLTLSLPASLPNPGAAELTVRATDSAGAEGYAPVKILCNTTNGVLEQRWSGTYVFTGTPSFTGFRTNFASAQNVDSTFTRRMSGWLIPPATGEYTFWLASDDDGWFYLSNDSTEAIKRPFAMVKGATAFQSWDEDATQKAQTFTLEAGKAYYIEGAHIENSGSDHLSVAWSGPGIARQPIPGSVLAPAIGGVAFQAQKPFAAWRTLKFGTSAADNSIAGANADPDNDGLSNLLEYALGLDPLNASAPTWQVTLANVSGQNYLNVLVNRDTNANDVVIDPFVTGSLTSPAWSSTNALITLNTPATFRARDTVPFSAVTNRFLRLRFTLP
ncbi:MAG TPA: M60 family metallopeptidase [Verrucomicrobiae bacterium]|jgi:hypothetical protein